MSGGRGNFADLDVDIPDENDQNADAGQNFQDDDLGGSPDHLPMPQQNRGAHRRQASNQALQGGSAGGGVGGDGQPQSSSKLQSKLRAPTTGGGLKQPSRVAERGAAASPTH